MILPASWPALLESFRPVFRRRGTFVLFTVLATGLVLQATRFTAVRPGQPNPDLLRGYALACAAAVA